MGKEIVFKRPDGQEAKGFYGEHAFESGAPAVVVLQEWWGITDHIKSIVDRLNDVGFRALAPDLYQGKIAKDTEEANVLMTGLDWGAAVHQDLRGAVQHLKATGSSKVAVVGFCMGGALSIASAVHIPELDAAVCYYGIPPKELADPSKISIPFLSHFANIDEWCTPEAVDALEDALAEGKDPFTLHRYDAQHAFFNETRPEVYNQEAAELSWERTLEFLRHYLM